MQEPDPKPVADRPLDIQRRRDAVSRFWDWMEGRLAGDRPEQEATAVAIIARMEARFLDGIADARYVIDGLARTKPDSPDLAAAARAMALLEERHRRAQALPDPLPAARGQGDGAPGPSASAARPAR